MDWQRASRISWFFIKLFCHLIWWDIILNLPILRWFRTPPLPRWQQIARDYSALATSLGGMLVKLGQFMSIRVDLLPVEVANELGSLQDNMPAASTNVIVSQIESDLGRPISDLFAYFEPEPIASASLAQVHLARLSSGQEVIVKVLRPGTSLQIETDLAMVALLIGVLSYIKPIRTQIDLEQLSEEFITVSRRELDLETEGKNAERFAQDFADDAQVYIPKIYWPYSGKQTLTLENVGYIKIGDLAALDAAGIDRKEVAKKLYQIFIRQVFIMYFIHADPHPGNLFIKPLPHPAEKIKAFAPGDPVPYRENRPFQIVLIDFGMSVEIPSSSHAWLKDLMIGVGMRDAHRIVQAYIKGNFLRPGVDLERVEGMIAIMVENYSELFAWQIPDMTQDEMRDLLGEYQDFLINSPFQFQADLLFMSRAIGLMSSVVKILDPDFDFTQAALPVATELLWMQWQKEVQGGLEKMRNFSQTVATSGLTSALSQSPELLKIAGSLTDFLTPNHSDKNTLTKEDRQLIQQLDQSVKRLTSVLIASSVFITTIIWHIGRQIVRILEGGSERF